MDDTGRTRWRAWTVGWLVFTGAAVALAVTNSPVPFLHAGVAGEVRPAGGWVTRGDGVVLEAASPVAGAADVDRDLVGGERLERYVAAVTTTNSGLVLGATRWDLVEVRYRIELDAGYPAGVRAELDAAFAWVSAATGVAFVPVDGPAEITVVGRADNGGLTVFDAPGGELTRVRIELGCCRRRVVWEEVLHAAGLVADRGPAGSLVADYGLRGQQAVDGPTAGDATVLRALYQVPPGAPADVVRDTIRRAAG